MFSMTSKYSHALHSHHYVANPCSPEQYLNSYGSCGIHIHQYVANLCSPEQCLNNHQSYGIHIYQYVLNLCSLEQCLNSHYSYGTHLHQYLANLCSFERPLQASEARTVIASCQGDRDHWRQWRVQRRIRHQRIPEGYWWRRDQPARQRVFPRTRRNWAQAECCCHRWHRSWWRMRTLGLLQRPNLHCRHVPVLSLQPKYWFGHPEKLFIFITNDAYE